MTNATRYATGDVRRTCVIPTDPNRPEPNRPYCNYMWSPSHHVVQLGDGPSNVAPSPVTSPDEMMALRAIEHQDFEALRLIPGGAV